MDNTETMTEFKNRIEKLSSQEQKEIFNIIKKNESIKYTQNKNGIFLLLNEIDTSTIENINLFLKYLDDSKKQTQKIEDKLKHLNNIKN